MADTAGDAVSEAVAAATEDAVETVTEAASEAAQDAVETVTEAASEAAQDAVETVTEAAEDAEIIADLFARIDAIETANAVFNAELEKLWKEFQKSKSSIQPKSAPEPVEPETPPETPAEQEPRRAASDVEESPDRRTRLNLRRY